MRYLTLEREKREAVDRDLLEMPRYLEACFSALTAAERVAPGPDRTFSPVEQCWHLADLEAEGFGVRISRLLGEDHPVLPDFDGDAVARERDYRARSLAAGLAAFRAARAANLAALRDLGADQWSRQGTQEGVGTVMLCDLPLMMAEHDDAHREEIEAWLRLRGSPAH